MLCSMSSGKSGSKWLDRLRSSKGFPTSDALDFEQFMTRPNPILSDSSDTNVSMSITNNIAAKSDCNSTQPEKCPVLDRNHSTDTQSRDGGSGLFGIVSNVLSELFNMGDPNSASIINGKKRSRKQESPKLCVVPTSADIDERYLGDPCRDNLASLPSSGDNSCTEMKRRSDQMSKQETVAVGSVDMEEEERSHADLSRFSRMEVTVIDTSCPSWKFEKLLFRRKNVWKVRDKKCKWMNIGKKKRKATALGGNVDGEKKAKHSNGQCSSAKEVNWKECALWSNEVQPNCETAEAAFRQIPKTLGHVPRKGQVNLVKNSKKGDSSVVLVKSFPTSKKHEANVRKKCLNFTQRK